MIRNLNLPKPKIICLLLLIILAVVVVMNKEKPQPVREATPILIEFYSEDGLVLEDKTAFEVVDGVKYCFVSEGVTACFVKVN